MKDADLNLNTSGNLPDNTAGANKAQTDPHADVSAADLERGFTKPETAKISVWDPDTTGENQVGDPFTVGGFLGRPRGFSR